MPDWTDWTESTELCVTCPVCAFAFDSIHTSGEGYSCPACAEIELDRTVSALRALVEAKDGALQWAYDKLGHEARCNFCSKEKAGEPCNCDILALTRALVLTEASMREKE